MVKNLPAMWETGFDPWVGKIPWRRKLQPTPISLPREFHGQRSLIGYSTCGLPSMGSHRVGHDWGDLAAAAAVIHGDCYCSGISILKFEVSLFIYFKESLELALG